MFKKCNESIFSTSKGNILLCYKMSFLGHTSKYEQSFVGLYSHVTPCIESTFNYTFTLGKMSFAFLFMNEDRDGRVVYYHPNTLKFCTTSFNLFCFQKP